MMNELIERSASSLPALRALMVVTMPDCLLYGSWSRRDVQFSAEDASGYFGDLVRANREGLRLVGSWTSDMQVTVEGADVLVVLKELNEHFVCCALFDREAPLGMIRLHLRIVIEQVRAALPKIDLAHLSPGARIVQFIERYAPDAHAALLRISTRTRIPVEQLRAPDTLTAAQVSDIEDAAKRILGLENIHL
ncbi:MAG: hypothetical protein OHK0013_45730 [Sandaracinaceae bacterium]